MSLSGFTSNGPINEHPGRKVSAKFLKSMFNARWDEQEIAGLELPSSAVIVEHTCSGGDKINLIPVVGLLLVLFSGL